MIFINQAEKSGLSAAQYEIFLRLLAPFAPHLSEELWQQLGYKTSVHLVPYPVHDELLAKDDTVTIGVQINGKVRGEITLSPDATEKKAWECVQNSEELKVRLENKNVKKLIYVAGRIINIIVE
jgi:leucyl-tRNA synthetase